jgi:uncharacterized membrane protein
MKKFTGYFLKGLLVFVPAALSIFAVVWVIGAIDNLMPFETPGVGIAATILVIFLTGFFASNFIGKKLFGFIDAIFKRLPVIKLLYSAAKDMIEAFAGERKSFDKPVIVELIKDGPKAMGFVTQSSLDFLGIDGHVAVYLPQSYNFAGSVLIFLAERVKPLDIDSSEAMTFIVSGGVSGAS